MFEISPAELFSLIQRRDDKTKLNFVMTFDGISVKTNSKNMSVFYHKGTICARCGIEGTKFRLERIVNTWVLNLYGVDENGNDILFNKDHIVPKFEGGSDSIDNLQPMCCPCNGEKGKDTWHNRGQSYIPKTKKSKRIINRRHRVKEIMNNK